MKLYRLIPDAVISISETGYICDVSEDLFYKLGFISKNDHMENYFNIRNGGMSWAKDAPSGKFFFFSPWDCLYNLFWLSNFYGREVARIFEYEVDDDIVKNSPQGFGYYNDVPFAEVKIPLKYLIKGATVNTELSSLLRAKMLDLALLDAEEAFFNLAESVSSYDYSRFRHQKEAVLKGRLKDDYFGSQRLLKVNERRFQNCGIFFESDFITGKSLVITGAKRDLLLEFLNNPSKYMEEIQELCDNSSGIFSMQNLKEFSVEHGFSSFDFGPHM